MFKVGLYGTHIAAFNEYTEYHIDFDDTSKYYTEDVLNYINESNIVVTSGNRDEVGQDLDDTLFTYDSVTGNASGSYTFNTWTAEEYLCHNWELLGQAISEVLDEMETEEEE